MNEPSSGSLLNLVILWTGAAICIFSALQFELSISLSDKLKSAFLHVIGCIFVFNIADICFIVFSGRPGMGYRAIILLLCFLEFFIPTVYMYAIHNLLSIYIGSEKETVKCVMQVLIILQAVLLLYARFKGLMYVVGDDNIMERRPYYPFGLVIITVMIIICFFEVSFNNDRLSRTEVIVFSIYLMAVIFSIILQIFMGNLMILNAANSLAPVGLFAFLMKEQSREYMRSIKEKSEMRASIMAGQLEPHFLSNTLVAIRALCEPDSESFNALTDLSKFMRGSMKALEEKAPIPIDEELDIVESYSNLQGIRFGEKIRFEWDVLDNSFDVPAFSVQIPVENAIKHGIQTRTGGYGKITIRTYITEDMHNVSISDDGTGFDESKTDFGTGLNNMIERVQTMSKGVVDITSSKGEGTTVTISVPRRGYEDSNSRR